ncbi:MAG TPA: flagellar hook capping FlgD N-terminal domain-containing protein, partial [Bdellovibrionales bacterium]|nr:flagellar hook capping FlgD N-terminal domain-containing protein [Bdellovibrionales bacterium]
MINVKGGTQTWTPQRTDFKPDGNNTISAADQEKFFQGESLGDTLNKVADPNYIDSEKKARTAGNNELGKDAFMSLLLTQMKNQDPTNPLKSHEMAAQLAQFTSLEKMTNVAEGIQGLRADMKPNANFQALSFIGKTVMADNSKIGRTDQESTHDVRFSIPADAQKITMQVKNADGAVVRTVEFKNHKAGKNTLNWNGIMDDGQKAPIGDYNISMEAVGSNGRKLQVEMKSAGVISGVNFTGAGPQLMIGKQVINMSDIKEISDPNLQMQEAPMMPPLPVG